MKCRLCRFVLVLLGMVAAGRCDAGQMRFWVAGGDGVRVVALDVETGKLDEGRLVSEEKVAWLGGGERGVLFAGGTLPDAPGATDGALSAFGIGPDGALGFLNRVPARGKTTIYVAAAPGGRAVFATNFRQDSYTSRGSVVAFGVGENGRIGDLLQRFEHPGRGGSDSDRQLASHPHSVVVGPRGEYAAVADLGVDRVFLYRMLADGKGLELAGEIVAKPGQQPRHLAWHPGGDFLYCMNEAAPTVSVARVDRAKGGGEFVQHLKRTAGRGGGGADVRIDSEGAFLFGSNRGEDTIVSFRIDRETGLLSLAGHVGSGGPSTRSLAVSPDDRWLVAANQGSDEVRVFAIDRGSGALQDTGEAIAVKRPACVFFVPVAAGGGAGSVR